MWDDVIHATQTRFGTDADFLRTVLTRFSAFAEAKLASVPDLDHETEGEYRDALMERAAADPSGPATVDVVAYMSAVICAVSGLVIDDVAPCAQALSAYAGSLQPTDFAGRIICARHMVVVRECIRDDLAGLRKAFRLPLPWPVRVPRTDPYTMYVPRVAAQR